MISSAFGVTGLTVARLGLGAGRLGEATVSDGEAERLLRGAFDLGVRFVDTAPSYGAAEDRIGRALGTMSSAERDSIVLSTKGGYGVEGVADWTGEVITRGVDQALARLRTDRIDIFHLHSCPRETLARDDILRALEETRRAGKIRVAAYSGENDALDRAIECGAFGGVQCSVNVCDQRALTGAISRATERGLGVVGKRAVANFAWRFAERPSGQYAEVYWDRLRVMNLDLGSDPLDTALRFSAFAPGVHAVLVGTASLDHLRRCVEIAARGPLPTETLASIRAAFSVHDDGWTGRV